MKFLTYPNINLSKWGELCLLSDFASPFQTHDFYHFIDKIPGYSAEVFAVEEDEQLLAIMLVVVQKEKGIKARFSKRGIIYGGPLLRSTNVAVVEFLLQKTSDELRKKLIFLETRNFFDYNCYKDTFLHAGWQYLPYLNYQISVVNKNTDELLSLMKYNRRREVKLSVAGGATFELAKSVEDVLDVYNILKNLYAEKVKLPLPDFDFFKSFLYSDIARVFVVKYDEKIIAGSFCFVYPGRNIYTMYYSGLREIKKKIFPTSLAVYAAIEYAARNGIQYVDLMGAGKPDQQYGVRDYKAQFGGELVEHGRFLKIFKPFLYQLGKTGLKIIGKFKS